MRQRILMARIFFYVKSKCYVSAFGQTYENLFLKLAFKGVKWNLGSLKAPKAKQWHENCCFPFFFDFHCVEKGFLTIVYWMVV